MSDADDVLDAAQERAVALARGDAEGLAWLLHPAFGWTSHTGEHLDRDAYLLANTGGSPRANRWSGQRLEDP